MVYWLGNKAYVTQTCDEKYPYFITLIHTNLLMITDEILIKKIHDHKVMIKRFILKVIYIKKYLISVFIQTMLLLI